MAISFDGTDDYIDVTDVTALAVPTGAVSISAWIRRNGNQNNNDRIAQKEFNNAATAPFVSYGFEFRTQPNVTFEVGLITGGVSGLHVTSAVTLDDLVWTHFVGTFDRTLSSNRLVIYKNGTSASTAAGADEDIQHNGSHFSLGARNSTGNFSAVALAEVAVWPVALTAAEAVALAKGVSPAAIRPASLLYYAPLMRSHLDRINGAAATTNGTTAMAHPRVIMPRRSKAIMVPVQSQAPRSNHQYRMRRAA